jgi:hypothetical protein
VDADCHFYSAGARFCHLLFYYADLVVAGGMMIDGGWVMIDELDHFVVKNLILVIILPTFVPVKN